MTVAIAVAGQMNLDMVETASEMSIYKPGELYYSPVGSEASRNAVSTHA